MQIICKILLVREQIYFTLLLHTKTGLIPSVYLHLRSHKL